MSSFPTLRSNRLILRELTAKDADAWFAIQSNPEVMRWFGADPMRDKAQAGKLIADYATWHANGTAIRWGIEWQGQLAGTCGYARWNKAWANAIAGYELGPEFQGKGLMREALQAMFRYGFLQMQLHRIHAEVHRDNIASRKLLEKLGFQFEGVHREMGHWGGRWHDLDCFSLLEHEWQV